MRATKQDRLREGFRLLGNAVMVLSIPVIWIFLVVDAPDPTFGEILSIGLVAAMWGIIVGLIVWLIPVWIYRVTVWVIDGFASAGSKDEAAPPPGEGE